MYSRAEHTPVGTVTARALNPTTRRGPPWQDRSPFDLWHTVTAVIAAPSQATSGPGGPTTGQRKSGAGRAGKPVLL
jgi:hypothetical protein